MRGTGGMVGLNGMGHGLAQDKHLKTSPNDDQALHYMPGFWEDKSVSHKTLVSITAIENFANCSKVPFPGETPVVPLLTALYYAGSMCSMKYIPEINEELRC